MRFKFGIRFLFAMTTICALLTWIGITQKNAELRRQELAGDAYGGINTTPFLLDTYEGYSEKFTLPFIRRLGASLVGKKPATPMISVNFFPGTSLAQIQEVVTLFPEIKFVAIYHSVASQEAISALKGLEHLEHLQIDGGRISDLTMKSIGILPQIPDVIFQNIHLDDSFLHDAAESGMKLNYVYSLTSSVTDSGLNSYKRLPDLISLQLKNCQITDTGLSALHRHPALRYVYLEDCPVSNESIKHLTEIPDLHQLSLDGTGVTDTGIAELAKAPLLWQISLNRTKVTRLGLQALIQSPSLKEISLDQTVIGDQEMAILAAIPKLEIISLANTQLTDIGLKTLATLVPRLKKLDVRNTKVTPAGIALINPACEVLK